MSHRDASDGKRTVLVVEDDPIIALDLQGILEKLGFFVPATAAKGEEAVAMAESLKPDIVFMDVRLRGKMDGIEASMQIMSRFNIPVIYLTASINEEKVRRIHPSGKCIFVTKPFEEYQLREAIETALHY